MSIFTSPINKFKSTIKTKSKQNTPTPLMALSDAFKNANENTNVKGIFKQIIGDTGLGENFGDIFNVVGGSLKDSGVDINKFKDIYKSFSGDINTMENADPSAFSDIDSIKNKFGIDVSIPDSSQFEVPKSESEMKEMANGILKGDVDLNFDITKENSMGSIMNFINGNDTTIKFSGLEGIEGSDIINKAGIPGINSDKLSIISDSDAGGMIIEDFSGIIGDIKGEFEATSTGQFSAKELESNKAHVLKKLNFDPEKVGVKENYKAQSEELGNVIDKHAQYKEFSKYIDSEDYDIAYSGDQTREEFKKYLEAEAEYEADPKAYLEKTGGKMPVNPNKLNSAWLMEAFSTNKDYSYMFGDADPMAKLEVGSMDKYLNNINLNINTLLPGTTSVGGVNIDPASLLDSFSIGNTGHIDPNKQLGHVHTSTSDIGNAFGSQKKHISHEPKMGEDVNFGNGFMDDLSGMLKGVEDEAGKEFGNIFEVLLKGPAAKLKL